MRSLKLVLTVAVAGSICISLSLLEAQSQPTQPTTTFQLERGAGALQYPSSWTPRHYSNVYELWNVTADKLASAASEERNSVPRIDMSVTPVANHAEALHRLREIEAESGMTSRYVAIGGWPALQRRQLVPKPHEGDDVDSDGAKLFMVTTAVAAGAMVVRMDGFAPETASPEVVDQMESIGRSWRPATTSDAATADKEVQQLQQPVFADAARFVAFGSSLGGSGRGARVGKNRRKFRDAHARHSRQPGHIQYEGRKRVRDWCVVEWHQHRSRPAVLL
jgi:hypothetical protein